MKKIKLFEYIKPILFFSFLFVVSLVSGQVITGADQVNLYLPRLLNKRVALVVNQTSMIRSTHLVDSLRKRKVNITCIFAPEHGFRGDHEAGAKVESLKDPRTGIPVISLYGKHKKPTAQDLKNVDWVVFDIQDVGARFYTYISTLHYVMQACAENKKTLVVLDRPNPNGFYVDGPVLDMKFQSFVGMHPVPVVHGLTIGEYAKMINGEKWLGDTLKCNLQVVLMKNYDHDTRYTLPVRPSPNLPSPNAILLYPSLCFFEGTNLSLGRGTDKPFECVGKPGLTHGDYYFTPKTIKGVSENPPYANKQCRGYLLSSLAENVIQREPKIYLSLLIDMYAQDTSKTNFFNNFFDNLAGTNQLRTQIILGKSEEEIRKGWEADLEQFKKKRVKYLLYRDYTVVYKLD
jgi:uncharacterized protein YbbC (DUF1343 family)